MDNTTIPVSFSYSYTPSSFKGGEYLSSNTLYWWYHSNTSTYTYDEARKATLFTAPMSGTYSFKIKAGQNATNCKFGFGTSHDNILSEITPTQNSSSSTEPTEYTVTINVNAGETIYIYPHIQGTQNAGLWIKVTAYSNTLSLQLTKNSNTVGYSQKNYLLGNLGIITIFGVKDKDFYIGEEKTSATTGSIAPGNFVGYIQIGKYKIPYYL